MGIEKNEGSQNGRKKNNKDEKKKVRRGGKAIKNKLKKFKVLYVNLRGYKSKRRSIEEIVEEERPTMLAFTETLLEQGEKKYNWKDMGETTDFRTCPLRNTFGSFS